MRKNEQKFIPKMKRKYDSPANFRNLKYIIIWGENLAR